MREEADEPDEARQTAARPPPGPPGPPPRKPVMLDPQALIGLDAAAVNRRLGRPSTVEGAPPSLVWRYVTPNSPDVGPECALDVIFFYDIADQEFRALTYKLRSPAASDVEVSDEPKRHACLVAIANAERDRIR